MRAWRKGNVLGFQPRVVSSSLTVRAKIHLCVAQLGRVLALEARGRRFKSSHADIESTKSINSTEGVKLWVLFVFYVIYKITNNLNGKIYIGKHQTEDLNDAYMGSGKILRRAIAKHGRDNFSKEILHVFTEEAEMNAKEAEIVSAEFVKSDSNYNLCPGGRGGFGYINSNPEMFLTERRLRSLNLGSKQFQKMYSEDDSFRANHLEHLRTVGHLGRQRSKENNPNGPFFGKTHLEETKEKLRRSKNRGSDNPQYGTMWITNGHNNRKIKRLDPVPEGWYKGRSM